MPARTKARKKHTAKRSPAKRSKTKKVTAKKLPKIKVIGKVVHYYDKIRVAIIELAFPIAVGDSVTFRRGDRMHTQQIGSIEIDHKPVQKAKKGAVIGVLVTQEIHDRSLVLPA